MQQWMLAKFLQKYVKGKPCKPYNSTLGEFFRVCNTPRAFSQYTDVGKCNWKVEDTLSTMKTPTSAPSSSANSVAGDGKTVTVSYLTEQTSHHPPVSAFYIDCPEKGISARGYDQLSAKFTGTSVRVVPGAHNLGIFITLKNRDNEEYQLTHPAAYLGGLLRGKRMQLAAKQVWETHMVDRISERFRRRHLLHHMSQDWAQGYP